MSTPESPNPEIALVILRKLCEAERMCAPNPKWVPQWVINFEALDAHAQNDWLPEEWQPWPESEDEELGSVY